MPYIIDLFFESDDDWEPSRAPTVRRLVLDPDGDLILHIGAEVNDEPDMIDAQVCSVTMRRSSPVFKAMLFGSWIEAKPSAGPWIVSLPDDKPAPLTIMLAIAHGRFDLVPHMKEGSTRRQDLELMVDVLTVADKYDLTRLLGPWAPWWINIVRYPHRNSSREIAQGMYVAWQLGSLDRLSSIIKAVVFTISKVELDCLIEYSEHCTSEGFPPALCRLIRCTVARCRLEVIQYILDFFHGKAINPRVKSTGWGIYRKGPECCHEPILCNALIATEISSYFRLVARTPPPEQASEVDTCAETLLISLGDVFTYVDSTRKLRGQHCCSLLVGFEAFKDLLFFDWQDCREVLPEAYRDRLQKRYEQLGYDLDLINREPTRLTYWADTCERHCAPDIPAPTRLIMKICHWLGSLVLH
ncbi:hypothetical protein N657DRAFT_280442 [Parathielavia appendiculata]|uniref:BTB domain-containing protein n=1 Tax=Parathielavia appendiculata TaxID=2587402 RepID=A0AAN6U3M0_9PEZI|nr:hypothetical protein N657DRAFT_280442 [Parathielavia appendiculata]